MKIKFPYTIVSRERLKTLMADHYYMELYRDKFTRALIEIRKLKEGK